jgi:hypothetical protein
VAFNQISVVCFRGLSSGGRCFLSVVLINFSPTTGGKKSSQPTSFSGGFFMFLWQ